MFRDSGPMQAHTMLRTGAALAGLAVLLGAFGAHGLSDLLAERGQLANYQTAVRYQMWHALALVLCGVLQRSGHRASGAAWCFAIGSAIFSGTLYVLAVSGMTWLGAITPLGGVLLIAGWVLLWVCAGKTIAADVRK